MPDPEARESIWSVHPSARLFYFLTFAVLMLVGTTLLAIHEFGDGDGTLLEDVVAVWRGAGSLVLASIAVAIVLTEIGGWIMVTTLNRFFDRRDALRAEGRNEGRTAKHREWFAWNARREAAAAENREFTEPPPRDD